MSLLGILLIILLLGWVFGGLGGYHSYGYSAYPMGNGIGTIVVILVVLWLLGVFR
jgi:hypothetical protein